MKKKYFWVTKIINLTPEAFWVLLGQAGYAFVGFAGIKLLTNLLDVYEFGRLSLANTITMFIVMNLFSPFAQGMLRFYSIYKNRNKLEELLSAFGRITIIDVLVSAFLIVPVFFIGTTWKNYEWGVLSSMAVLLAVFSGLTSFKIAAFGALRQRKYVSILNVSGLFLQVLLACLFMIMFSKSAGPSFAGFLLGSALVFFIANMLFRKATGCRESDRHNKDARMAGEALGEILRYSAPFIAFGLLNWIYMSSYKWILQLLYGANIVGAFSLTAQMSFYPIILISGILHTFFTPIAFQKAGDLTKKASLFSANKILLTTLFLNIIWGIGLIICFYFFHNKIMLLASSSHFAKFSYLLPWFALAWALFNLGEVASSFGLLIKRPVFYIIPKAASSIIALFGGFCLADRFGPLGIIWGLIFAGLVYSLWCLCIAFKITDNFGYSSFREVNYD